jgi:hypothetical protein
MKWKNSKGFVTLLLVMVVGLATAAVPAGYYYTAHNKTKAELKTSLSALATPVKVLKYGSGEGATWQGFFYTDQFSDGSVVDMYSNIIRYFDGFSGISGMHIEHSLPKSWWGGAENMAYRDLFHLYPSDGSTNSSKSNHPLGVVMPQNATFDNGVSRIGTSTFTTAYTGKAFEPADEFKGDFARSYLYIATVYEHFAPLWTSPMMQRNTYPVWTSWARELLLQWHAADPVSVKERLRQEAIYAIQGNRNPFIDYPDLVSYIWGPDTLKAYPFPQPSDAFLTLPRRGEVVDFDVILQGDTIGKSIQLKGQNLSGTLTVQLKHRHPAFFVLRSSIPSDELPGGSATYVQFRPTAPGTFRDTLVIEGAGLNEAFLLPVEGKAARQLMVLEPDRVTPVGATLHWIADLSAVNYAVELFTNPSRAGNLIISSYVEGSSYNKAVEIYNGTGRKVQLADYALAKQSNGTGNYESVVWLNGELEHGSSVMVVNKLCTNEELKAKAALYTDSVMNFNGNDAIALLHNSLRVDAVGYFDAGPALMWGENKTLHRKAQVTHPTASFNEEEWISLPADDFSTLGNHVMNLSTQENSLFTITIPADSSRFVLNDLQPLSQYYFRVSAIRDTGNLPSVNSVGFTTAGPVVPVSLEPSDIGARHFVAEWESDLYTGQFELQVYSKAGSADVTVVEGFDKVGSNGKPLPEGWSGTAGAVYTTSTSSGVAPPSIQLRNTGEWLQTAVYPYAVSKFGFMYRYPSSGAGNVFTVEALKADEWVKVDDIGYMNTSKTELSYTFDRAENVRSLRITFANKVSGNLALDDFIIVYGSESNVYLLQQQPVDGTTYRMESLEPETNYFYRVRSVIGGVRSGWSDEVQLKTLVISGLHSEPSIYPRWSTTPEGIVFSQLGAGSRLQLYTLTGVKVHDSVVAGTTVTVPIKGHPMYIVRIVNSDQLFSFKIIL